MVNHQKTAGRYPQPDMWDNTSPSSPLEQTQTCFYHASTPVGLHVDIFPAAL